MLPCEKQPSQGKKAPRKKTGCFACRVRHTKCDEKLPTCSGCVRGGLRCERSAPIIFEPQCPGAERRPTTSRMRRKSSPSDAPQLSPSVEAYLLRRFQDGIATWIDLFDHQQHYQRMLMRRIPDSALLRHAVCALAARQLALQQGSARWDRAASEHYSIALRLQSEAMGASPMSELLLPATLLLASYELMLLHGKDYSQHLLGAKAILEVQFSALQHNTLWLAAYWHYFRHDVSVALTSDCPIRLSQQFWLESEFGPSIEEDSMGNSSLVLIAKALQWQHGPIDATHDSAAYLELRKEVSEWNSASSAKISAFQTGEEGVRWYAIPAAPPADQQALIAELLLRGRQRRRYSSKDDTAAKMRLALTSTLVKQSFAYLIARSRMQHKYKLCITCATFVERFRRCLPSNLPLISCEIWRGALGFIQRLEYQR